MPPVQGHEGTMPHPSHEQWPWELMPNVTGLAGIPGGSGHLTCSAGPGRHSKCRCGRRGCRAAGAGAAAPRATPGRGTGTRPKPEGNQRETSPACRVTAAGTGPRAPGEPWAEPSSPTAGKEPPCWAMVPPTQLRTEAAFPTSAGYKGFPAGKGQVPPCGPGRGAAGDGRRAVGKEAP